VPNNNAPAGVTGCFPGNAFCVGGDLSGAPGSGASLKSSLKRINGYSRIGYDFAENSEFYVTVNVAQVKTSNQPSPGYNRASLTVQCANAFLPQSIKDRCANAGITHFGFGSSNGNFPDPKVFTDRRQYRFVGGLKGDFGGSWKYDAYYENGTTISNIDVDDIVMQNRYVAATNADHAEWRDRLRRCYGAGGRMPADQHLWRFRPVLGSARLRYAPSGPFQHTRLTQDVASINFSGEPLNLWAGPLSVAFGGEYRHEFYRVNADPYGAGVSTISPNSADYPVRSAAQFDRRGATGPPATTRTAAANTMSMRVSSSSTCRCSTAMRGPREPERCRARDALQHVGHRVGVEDRRHLGYAARRRPPARGDLARRPRAEPVGAVRRADRHDAAELQQSVPQSPRCRRSRTRSAIPI
jgi:hypothetical protein